MILPNLEGLTIEDRKLYFQKTHILVHDRLKKESRWAYVTDFGSSVVQVNFEAAGLRGKLETFPIKDSRYELENFFPPSGVYNTSFGVVLATRTPARQTKKSICNETHSFVTIPQLFRKFGWIDSKAFPKENTFAISNKGLTDVFLENAPLTLPKAYEAVRKFKRIAAAVSPDMYLTANPEGQYPKLWFRDILIGEAVSPKKLLVSNRLFVQEAADMWPGLVEVDNG